MAYGEFPDSDPAGEFLLALIIVVVGLGIGYLIFNSTNTKTPPPAPEEWVVRFQDKEWHLNGRPGGGYRGEPISFYGDNGFLIQVQGNYTIERIK